MLILCHQLKEGSRHGPKSMFLGNSFTWVQVQRSAVDPFSHGDL